MENTINVVFILLLTSCLAAQDKRNIDQNSETSDASAFCQSVDPAECFGEAIQGGYDADENKQSVEISFVFINSSSEQLSFNANNDADRTVDSLNLHFISHGHRHLKFVVNTVEEVIDDLYYNTECNFLDNVMGLYGKQDSLTFVFVNDLADSCRGVAKLWVNPEDFRSGLLLQHSTNIEFFAGIYAHELGHNVGLHHSARTYSQSAPVSGLYSFNELLGLGGVLPDRCDYDFMYFIDPRSQSTNSVESGITFNSYENIMYPSFGDGIERTFLSQGYDYSTTRAFDCWYNLLKQSGIGLSED